MNPDADFIDAIKAAGLVPPDKIQADGNIHRFSSSGKRGDDAGYYAFHNDNLPAGMFGCHRENIQENWCAMPEENERTEEEKAQHRERMQEMRRQRDEETQRRSADATAKALELWNAAKAVIPDHPYLVLKGVSPAITLRELSVEDVAAIVGYRPKARGELLTGRILIAPVKIGDSVSTAELIDETGRKSALAGGAKKGGYWAAQPLPDDDGTGLILMIGEGVATTLSAVEATGHLGIAALSSGNLGKVAQMMKAKYPESEAIVILADLVKSNGEPDPNAVEAARSVGGLLAVPHFGVDRPEAATDLNDMATLRGIESVRTAIADVLSSTVNPESDPASSDSGVTRVTRVQASNGGASGVTPDEKEGVTGVTPDQENPIPSIDDRPKYCVFDDWVESGSTKYRPGVYYFGIKHSKKPDESPTLIEQWICTPLHVQAVTFDTQDNNYGRLIRFQNTMNRWREWAMPMELLRGAGDELRGELLAMGVSIDPSSHRMLGQYLQAVTPKRKVHCALQVGWCGDSYVLPDTVIGPKASGVIFQSGERGHDEHTRAGTLDGWKSEIAALGVGNPLLTIALSASFAGPLLAKCNAEGGGIHFVGDSSTGKTTAIEAACATWGGPNFRRSWRATANGMEGAASLFNDCLLALDEISECDPREVGAIVYALGNGRGKQRASRSGNARGVTRWRCVVLSSGERTIETTMVEGGRRAKAGQSVRLLDIPAARKFGAWDELHGFTSGTTFSDALKRSAVTHHGHAGRAFLEQLTRDGRDFCELLERIKALPNFAAEDGEGQDKRSAGRFALFALAGEIATEYGLTGWPEGEAIKAAAEGFELWRTMRGRGNDERRQILDRVNSFIERHGDSRFSDSDRDESHTKIIDRAGWWKEEPTGRVYLFNKDGLREALRGFDFKRSLDTLQDAGAIPPPEPDGKRAKSQRIGGRLMRLYSITADKLEG